MLLYFLMNNSLSTKKHIINVSDVKLEYFLKYSKRISIEIKIKADGQIYVSAPFYVQKKDIEAFLIKKYTWIRNKLINFNDNREDIKDNLNLRKTIPLFGRSVSLEIIEYDFKNVRIGLKDDILKIELPEGFNDADKNLLIGETLKKFYISKTREYLNRKLMQYVKIIGVEVKSIRIKNQKSRWGSCSSKKNLNFNFRLSMMPEAVFDYIIVHELCHLKEMNHSQEFWKLVKEVYPDCDAAKAWIKENTKMLMFI